MLTKARAIHLRQQVLGGSWIVLESSPLCTASQRRTLHDVFGILLHEPIAVSSDHLYVRYNWPHVVLTRTFSAVIPISCSEKEVIAHYGRTPVAMKRPIGRGGIVFLGSMLGPNLRAEEREARKLAAAIFSRTTYAYTSTAASTNT